MHVVTIADMLILDFLQYLYKMGIGMRPKKDTVTGKSSLLETDLAHIINPVEGHLGTDSKVFFFIFFLFNVFFFQIFHFDMNAKTFVRCDRNAEVAVIHVCTFGILIITASHVSNNPNLNFVIYTPGRDQYPLHVLHENGKNEFKSSV